MNPVNRSVALMLAVAMGAGCVQQSVPTVEYFRAHGEERAVQLHRCANDPGSLQTKPACVNAQQAADLERHDSLRNLPSMGLHEQIPPKPAAETATDKAQ